MSRRLQDLLITVIAGMGMLLSTLYWYYQCCTIFPKRSIPYNS